MFVPSLIILTKIIKLDVLLDLIIYKIKKVLKLKQSYNFFDVI